MATPTTKGGIPVPLSRLDSSPDAEIRAGRREARRLVSIVGEAALSEAERRYLAFADSFEQTLVNQGATRRTIEQTLELAWTLLRDLPPDDLKRIDPALVERYAGPGANVDPPTA